MTAVCEIKPGESKPEEKTFLPYLKRYSPATETSADTSSNLSIDTSASPGATLSTDAFARPARLGRWRSRWFALSVAATHLAAIGLALALSRQVPVVTPASTPLLSRSLLDDIGDNVGGYLNPLTFEHALQATEEKRFAQLREEQLAAAEHERLHAQQLRIDSEQQAEALVAGAAQRARETRMRAVQQADAIRLDSTFIGAEQVLYGNAGDDVTLRFAARIQCQEGSFGDTAIATPVNPDIARREVRNLAVCHPNPRAAAGAPIGVVGEVGVAFFKIE